MKEDDWAILVMSIILLAVFVPLPFLFRAHFNEMPLEALDAPLGEVPLLEEE